MVVKGIVGDNTTQLYKDYQKPLQGSRDQVTSISWKVGFVCGRGKQVLFKHGILKGKGVQEGGILHFPLRFLYQGTSVNFPELHPRIPNQIPPPLQHLPSLHDILLMTKKHLFVKQTTTEWKSKDFCFSLFVGGAWSEVYTKREFFKESNRNSNCWWFRNPSNRLRYIKTRRK